MNKESFKSTGPNWVETAEGDVMPSYGGTNAPLYPGSRGQARLDSNRFQLEEMHEEMPGRDTTAQPHEQTVHAPPPSAYRNATNIFVQGRRDVLG